MPYTYTCTVWVHSIGTHLKGVARFRCQTLGSTGMDYDGTWSLLLGRNSGHGRNPSARLYLQLRDSMHIRPFPDHSINKLTQRVHIKVYGRYLGLKEVPISLLWGLGVYYNDTWTLWVTDSCRSVWEFPNILPTLGGYVPWLLNFRTSSTLQLKRLAS